MYRYNRGFHDEIGEEEKGGMKEFEFKVALCKGASGGRVLFIDHRYRANSSIFRYYLSNYELFLTRGAKLLDTSMFCDSKCAEICNDAAIRPVCQVE